MPDKSWWQRPVNRVVLIWGAALVSMVLFMVVGVQGNWGFVLEFRGMKLATMVVVAISVSVSTLIFQSIVHNRILTPSFMGFDSLYQLVQTVLIFTMGSAFVATWDTGTRFLFEMALMVLFAVLLYRMVFSGGRRNIYMLMLVGIIFSVLFRSLNGFLQRIIDPNEFLMVLDRYFASFNRPEQDLLLLSAAVVLLASIWVWRNVTLLDVVALGRDTAINLGVNYNQFVIRSLLIVSVLVAGATALVGPFAFLGLLVVNIAYLLVPSHRHSLLIPASIGITMITLTAGQMVLEQWLGFGTALSVIIEFVGGLFFIFMLVRGSAK
jgi:iron complex transport system permease protein